MDVFIGCYLRLLSQSLITCERLTTREGIWTQLDLVYMFLLVICRICSGQLLV